MKIDKVVVLYMASADSADCSWVSPQKADINETSFDQIITTKVQVHHSGSVKNKYQIECIGLID